MGIRAMLRAAVLLLLIRTWLAEGNNTTSIPEYVFELSPTMPAVIHNVFNCKNCANETVVGKILDRVLSGYDARLRPYFGGDPLPVGISMYVSNIDHISEVTMDSKVTMFFLQTWKDPRLAYCETNLNLTLDYRMADKLWVPDCYFLNSKDTPVHDMSVENRMFQLHPDGTVHYGMRLTTTASCSMDLQKYPLDKQTCKLEVESYGYTVEDIMLYWEGDENAIQGTEKIENPQFTLLGKKVTRNEEVFYTGSYVRLVLKFMIQRKIIHYLVQVYWPTIIVTISSWVTFWMNYESSVARMTIGLTSMFILHTINSHLREKLPEFSCIKAIDIYMVVCFIFVFLSLLEYVYINYLLYSRRESSRCYRLCRRARKIMDQYRYQLEPELQFDIKDESGSPLPRSVQAHSASPESLISLTLISDLVPLATSESLSSLSSLSLQSWLATEESLNDLSSTSEQTLHSCDSHVNGFETDDSVIPTKIYNPGEAHCHAETFCYPEDPKESYNLDDNHGYGPNRKHLLIHSQRCVPEAICEPDNMHRCREEFLHLPGDINIQQDYLDVQNQLQHDDDATWSHDDDDDNFMGFDEDEDSSSESDDSCPPSPGYSCRERLFSDIFDPDYIPNIDKWCRILFPLAFVVFNIIYWPYHSF
uniref:Gamma-aminobutyric acid receptor subunit beta n=1 Tax=Pipistrellus kuhlii TaxID=59472 RepID=A0A7J7S5T1_PIPKU|nr:gamma-aminobutyric acid type A receptor subunit theta [Pipistrellus kuhlii]